LDGHRSLLQATRQAKLPNAVAEVTAKLTEDGRRRVGDERPPALGIEAVKGLDQAQARNLDQVLQLLRGTTVPEGERASERQEAVGELVLQRRIAGLRVAAQELVLVSRALARRPADVFGTRQRSTILLLLGQRSRDEPHARRPLGHRRLCRHPLLGAAAALRCRAAL
jgi:hypothetical protein